MTTLEQIKDYEHECIHSATVIQLGLRYFAYFSENKIVTSWSLAGAKMFLKDSKELTKTTEILTHKKRKYELYTVIKQTIKQPKP